MQDGVVKGNVVLRMYAVLHLWAGFVADKR